MSSAMNIYLLVLGSVLLFQSIQKTEAVPILANVYVLKPNGYHVSDDQLSRLQNNGYAQENFDDLIRIMKNLMEDATKNLMSTKNDVMSQPKYG